MKSHLNIFKWFVAVFALSMFWGFSLTLPSVSAQEGTPPTSTETPIGTSSTPEATQTEPPTSTPVPSQTEEPLNRIPNQIPASPSGISWSEAINISNTTADSDRPRIAVDINRDLHIVWSEMGGGSNKREVYYSYFDKVTGWSTPFQVSNSPTLDSDTPKLVIDNSGTAHVVWMETDDDHNDDFEILYSKCSVTGCTSPVVLSNGKCSIYTGDWKSTSPAIGISGSNLMVAWAAYEPGGNYIPYSSWLVSGNPPTSRTGCHPRFRSYSHIEMTGGLNNTFHLAADNNQYGSTYYSRFNGSVWADDAYLGVGGNADIYAGDTNQIHVAWKEASGAPRYSFKTGVTPWITAEAISGTLFCNQITIGMDQNNLPLMVCDANGRNYMSSRQATGWTEPIVISDPIYPSGLPDLTSDTNGNPHLVWTGMGNGNWEIFYTTTAHLPVIFLPGLTGSRIYAPQSFTWSEPNGYGGNYEHQFDADEQIWINNGAALSLGPDNFFDILRLEKDGTTQSTNKALYGFIDLKALDIVGTAEIIGEAGLDIYDEFLAELQSAGYQSDIDLFIFPYDWRLDISHNAQLLDNKVLEVLGIVNGTEDQSQWKITQVNLVAHSMGASVAREYISYPAQATHVHRLIAVGPVFLGAPKPLKGILFGDTLGIPGLNADEVKDIVQNMPGVFQVTPSGAYWDFYDGTSGNPVAFQESYDFDEDNQELGDLSYDQYKSLLFRLDRDPYLNWDVSGKDINQTVFNRAEAFHNRLDSSWDSGIPIPEVDLIVGTGLCSIGQYQSVKRFVLGSVKIHEVNGDGTVPLFSSSLYDPDRGIDHRGGANVYYIAKDYSTHAFMLSKDPIKQLVISLLDGGGSLPSEGIIQEADVPESCSGEVIGAEGPVELHVTDAEGNHTGWSDPVNPNGSSIEENIPQSQYEEIETTKSIYLPHDGEYTISLKANGSSENFNLFLHLYKSDGTEKTIVYLRAPLTITTTGEIFFDTSSVEPPLLNLDHNGDGVIDNTIQASSILGTAESNDSNPPQTEIISPSQGQTLTGSTLIKWQSTDDISGILNEWGYIDMGTPNEQLILNDEVVTLVSGEHTLTVLAEDRLGNLSQEQVSFTIQNSIFSNGFESGNFSAWSWATTDGGDLSVSAQSAGVGVYGMQAFFDDNHEIVVYDHSPNNEKHYSARFYFDPNSVDITSEDGFYLFAGASDTGWVACVYLEQQGDHYSLALCGKDDAGTWLKSDAILIADEWQAVEVEWKAATAVGANDGYIKLWIGDQLVNSIENVDSDTQFITKATLGATNDTFTASGTMYFDAFESHAGTHIGLDPNGPAVTPPQPRPDLMFADDFESGDLARWNLTLTTMDGGDLFASPAAAHQGSFGLQALIDDAVSIRTVNASPADEKHYHARFYFNPNSLTMNSGNAHFIFDGVDMRSGSAIFRTELIYENGVYKLRPRIMKDGSSAITGSKYTISNDWHMIELEWQGASVPGANDGFLSFWIDGVLMGTISGVDNDTHRLDQARLGVTAGLDAGTSGSMFFDQFESRRDTYIGP